MVAITCPVVYRFLRQRIGVHPERNENDAEIRPDAADPGLRDPCRFRLRTFGFCGGGGTVNAKGIYAILDPHNPAEIGALVAAGSASCSALPGSNPFCATAANGTIVSSVNGIFLTVNWCSWQLAHLKATGASNYCNYYVEANSPTGTGVNYNPDTGSPCPVAAPPTITYDACIGSPESVLYATLADIDAIDAKRVAAGLSRLKISI